MSRESRLEELRWRATLYELAVDGRILAGYCKHGKRNILTMLRKHGESWAAKMTETDQIVFAPNGRSVKLGPYRIEFTGRTQRQAIIEGELPWFKDVAF